MQALPRILKRSGVHILQPGRGLTYGNVKELGNAGGSFGERCLVFSTTLLPQIRLPGDGVNRLVKHLVIRGVRCASNCP